MNESTEHADDCPCDACHPDMHPQACTCGCEGTARLAFVGPVDVVTYRGPSLHVLHYTHDTLYRAECDAQEAQESKADRLQDAAYTAAVTLADRYSLDGAVSLVRERMKRVRTECAYERLRSVATVLRTARVVGGTVEWFGAW